MSNKNMEIPVVKSEFEKLLPTEINIVGYHKNCNDGFSSRCVVEYYNKINNIETKIKYYPISYGYTPPNVTGKNVLLCDISFKKDVMLSMIEKANTLLIIDHHKSAEKNLADIEDKYKIFDMNHCGAVLTWKYFFPNREVPLLLKYVEDRDIWTKKMANTDAFNSWFVTVEKTYDNYVKYFDDDKLLLEMIERYGKPYQALNKYNIEKLSVYLVPKFMKIRGKFYFVGTLNSNVLKSDLGNYVFNNFPYIDFSTIYSIGDHSDYTYFSLRSTNKHVDVSKIAFSLGGGGHRNASGASVSYITNVLPGAVYDGTGRMYRELEKIYQGSIKINEDKYFNIVYLNMGMHKTKLGRYLLQTKYINEKNTPIQTCRAIMEQRDTRIYNKHFHIAAIWAYNGVTNRTEYSIVLDYSLSDSDKMLIQKHFSSDLSNGLVYGGVVTKL